MNKPDEALLAKAFDICCAIRALDQLAAVRTEAMNLALEELGRLLDQIRRHDLYGMRLDEVFHRYDHHRREAEKARVFKRLEVGDLLLPECLQPSRSAGAESVPNNPNFFWYVVAGEVVLAGFDPGSHARAYAAEKPGREVLHRSQLSVRFPEYASHLAQGESS